MKYVLFFVISLVLFTTSFSQEQQLGVIDFPNSGGEEVQPHILTGVLLLHSFEYEDAAEEFMKAQKADPYFALAYWGEAMTYNHPIWMQQDYERGAEVLKNLSELPVDSIKIDSAGVEARLIQAVNILYGDGDKKERDFAYMEYLKQLHKDYPENDEVASFYCLSILGTSHNGRDLTIYAEAAKIGEEVFARNPDHPGALHYLIHSYDDPESAHLGLEAADRYAKVAPDAAHALHMPSHIYVAKGMWEQVVSSNIASAAAAESRMIRKGLNLQARGYHALWWLEYGYLQQAKYMDALKILEQMHLDQQDEPTARTTFHLVAERAHFLIETNDWDHDVGFWEIDASPYGLRMNVTNQFVMGMRAAKLKEVEEAEQCLIKVMLTINEGISENSERDLKVWLEDMDVNRPSPDELAALIMEKELEALVFDLSRSMELAEEALQVATLAEENMPFMFGPPVVVKPSHELYGEMLLKWGRPSEAKYQFLKGLERAPNRSLSLLGLAQASNISNDRVTAEETKRKLEEIWKSADKEMTVYDR